METQRVIEGELVKMEQAYLLPVNQSHQDSFEVGEFMTIGRDSCNTVRIQDPFVSSRHLRIEKRNRESRKSTLLFPSRFLPSAHLLARWSLLLFVAFFLLSLLDGVSSFIKGFFFLLFAEQSMWCVYPPLRRQVRRY